MRNEHPAFSGRFELVDSGASMLVLSWMQGAHAAELRLNLRDLSHRLAFSDGSGTLREFSLAV